MPDDDHRRNRPARHGGRARFATAAAIVLLAATGIGCGSDAEEEPAATAAAQTAAQARSDANGVQSRSPEAILEAARQAAREATSVRVRSRLDRTVLSVNVLRDEGAHGSIAVGAGVVRFRALGDDLFVTGDGEVLRTMGLDQDGVRHATEGWLRVPPQSAEADGFRQLTTMAFVESLLRVGDGRLSKGRVGEVNESEAVPVTFDDGEHHATLHVAVLGSPLPVRVDAVEGRDVTIFDRWNEPIELVAPADAEDLSGSNG